MRKIRRISSDVHVELTPMIDVVFLLLTFFFFTIVMMVRADVLDVNLPELTAGTQAQETIPVAISIDADGAIFVNGEPTAIDGLVEMIKGLKEDELAMSVVLAVDTDSPAGVMISVADVLTGAGMGEFSIIGHRADDAVDQSNDGPIDEGSDE